MPRFTRMQNYNNFGHNDNIILNLPTVISKLLLSFPMVCRMK